MISLYLPGCHLLVVLTKGGQDKDFGWDPMLPQGKETFIPEGQ
jgi:hypothetical protein